MSQLDSGRRSSGTVLVWAGLLVLATVLSGCETRSFLDLSDVGRFEGTPALLPILDRIDFIGDDVSQPPGLTQVRPEDLVNTAQEYNMGPGDLITVTVFELIVLGQDYVQTRRVDELGMVRLPEIGKVKVEGLTPSQLEDQISATLIASRKLVTPAVSVIVQESRQNVFNVIGEPLTGATQIGTYTIIGKDFRLLDALTLARGVNGTIKKVYVIRQVPLTSGDKYKGKQPVGPGDGEKQPPAKPSDLLPEDLLKGLTPDTGSTPAPGTTSGSATAPAGNPPTGVESGLEGPADGARWIYVNNKWVKVERTAPADGTTSSEPAPVLTQRIIEVPWDKLLEGDLRYNVVIRPGDTIRVPPASLGLVYIGGQISRPGTYSLPGDKDMTLKQLVFAAGNLSSLAVPERVDLIRRVGKDQEATVRLNVRAIFAGTQPDIFLKPNDTINVGTSGIAFPLQVIRNGFRTSYGFGFVLDRNFDQDVFGSVGQ